MFLFHNSWIFILALAFFSCETNASKVEETISSNADYIRAIPGENDQIPPELAQKGEVLIAYSDCYTCHTKEKRSKGPAFEDIAKRYPVQEGYVTMLAYRVIAGGSGAWGSPVMLPHPDLRHEDAKNMVYYILSLKEMDRSTH